MPHPFFQHRHACDDAEAAYFMGRHHGRGFGMFGGRHGGFGLGGAGFFAGRKLGSGDLQLVLLALLADRPGHGYELIKAIEERSGGFYTPSPGVVYPALTYLEEVGYASVAAEGSKKLYSVTAEGRAHLEQHRETADAILARLEFIGARMGRVREVVSGLEDDGLLGLHEVMQARRELKAALRGKRHASAAEKKRIVEILRRAAVEIRGED